MDRLEKAEEKLEAAALLLEQGYYGDAVSRAYYSMFHAAAHLLESEDVRVKTHTGLIRMVGKWFVKSGRMEERLGRALSMVEEDREMADYALDAEFSRERAEEDIGLAREFLDEVRELTSGSD